MSLSDVDRKARKCAITALPNGDFAVTSPSGPTYRVTLFDEGATAMCTCAWGQTHPFAACETGCAHMRAVWAYQTNPENVWRVTDQASATYARLRDKGFSETAAAAAADAVVGLFGGVM